jgi:hypothetical protein
MKDEAHRHGYINTVNGRDQTRQTNVFGFVRKHAVAEKVRFELTQKFSLEQTAHQNGFVSSTFQSIKVRMRISKG